MVWSLANSCEGKFVVGQRVRLRVDMGSFHVTIIKIYNDYYCVGRTWRFGKKRHFNMNCLEAI
jgi:hypothetical protein